MILDAAWIQHRMDDTRRTFSRQYVPGESLEFYHHFFHFTSYVDFWTKSKPLLLSHQETQRFLNKDFSDRITPDKSPKQGNWTLLIVLGTCWFGFLIFFFIFEIFDARICKIRCDMLSHRCDRCDNRCDSIYYTVINHSKIVNEVYNL